MTENNPLRIILEFDVSDLVAQITEQITKSGTISNNEPHYVTKKGAMAIYGWSEHHLKIGEKEGFLSPLRMAGKGEIRYSYQELTTYHNHLQKKHGVINVQPNTNTRASKSGRNALASRKR